MLTKAQTGGAKELKGWHEAFHNIYTKYRHEAITSHIFSGFVM